MKEHLSPSDPIPTPPSGKARLSMASENLAESQENRLSLTPTEWPTKSPFSKASALRYRWYESWIIRAAFIAAMILFLGFAVSFFFTYTSIDSIANIAHDPDVESSLEEHLDSLKKVHELRQLVIRSRLLPLTENPAWRQELSIPFLDKTLHELTGDLDLGERAWQIKNVENSPTENVGPNPPQEAIRWLSRDELRILDYDVVFAKSALYDQFKKTEDLKKRYQLIGLKLQAQIIPSLIKASVIVLVVSFLILVSLFFAYARSFKSEINDVIEGFSIWSEKDVKFRFDESYPGELRLITNQFNEMADEVESNRQKSLYLEKIASWQIIARKLAHEIKNPLTPIQMMVSQLKRRYKGDDPQFAKLLDEAQTIISEEVAGLRRMVDSFSQFARLPEPKPQKTDLGAMCKHVIDLQKNIFTHHTFQLKAPVSPIYAEVDEDLLRQVVLNIVKNAGEASADKPANITISLAETSGEVLLEIHDNGAGIPPEFLERIFEAYFTTKHTGPTPGMGLGLAVCQKIVMDHRGLMSVKSHPGSTTFSIRLPKQWKA